MKKTRKKAAKAAKAQGPVHAKSVETPKPSSAVQTVTVDWSSGIIPRREISEWKSYFVQPLTGEEQPMWLDGLFHATIDNVIVRQDDHTTGHVWIRFKMNHGREDQPTYAHGRWYFPEIMDSTGLHISQLLRPWLGPEDMKAETFDLKGQIGRKCQVVVRMHTYTSIERNDEGCTWWVRYAVPVVQLVLPSDYQPYLFRGLPRT